MTFIVKAIARITIVFILVYGIYIAAHGHLTPGGGFAGGIIIALSFIQLMLAYGRGAALAKLSKTVAALFESFGAIALLAIALLGFMGGYFFLNFFASKGAPFTLFSAGIIPLANIAIMVKVCTGVFAIFVVLVLLKMKNGGDK